MNYPRNRTIPALAPRHRALRPHPALIAAGLGAGLVLSGCLAELDVDPSYDQQALSDEFQTAFVTRDWAYAWTQSATGTFTASNTFARNSSGNIAGDIGDVTTDITAGRTSLGRYSVQLPGMSSNGSNVQVTAYGSGPEYCKVVNWGGTEANAEANVACFDATGAAVDTLFVIVYTDDKFIVL